jgi:5-methyltetrahydrofolate--homocysteine methyltransferase
MDLTEAFQLLPEQSTAAVIIHHPEAKYYAVRGSAADVSSLPEAAVA